MIMWNGKYRCKTKKMKLKVWKTLLLEQWNMGYGEIICKLLGLGKKGQTKGVDKQ